LLGANGAGKTTTLRAVSGTVRRSGDVVLGGKRLARATPEAVARHGVAHVPEGRGIFAELTVWENLRMGGYTVRRPDFATVLGYFPWLEERRNQQAGTLSGGEQQMLALARAFLSRPRLLMLDEPSLGLAPTVVDRILDAASQLARDGTAILLVEQAVEKALARCHKAYVLDAGRIAHTAPASELVGTNILHKSYLGQRS
jgi:branched-chain amino acid transport system ATP-binding protein